MDAEQASEGKIENIETRFLLSFRVRTSAYFHIRVSNGLWAANNYPLVRNTRIHATIIVLLSICFFRSFRIFNLYFVILVLFLCCRSHRRCAVNQKIIKLVLFTALAIGTAAAAVRQQKPQLTTIRGAEERDRRCPLHFDNQKIVFYPHETDCTQYYLCAENGTLVELQCPNGLEFDADFSVRLCSIFFFFFRPLEWINRSRRPPRSNKVEQSDWKYFCFFSGLPKNRFVFGQMVRAAVIPSTTSIVTKYGCVMLSQCKTIIIIIIGR